MKLTRTSILKHLLVIAPALLLAIILKPAVALAEDYTVIFVIADDSCYFADESGLDVGTKLEVNAPDGKVECPKLVAKSGYEGPDYTPIDGGKLDGYEPYWTADADVTCDGTCVPAGQREYLGWYGLHWDFSVTQNTTITIRSYPRVEIWFQGDEMLKSVDPHGFIDTAGEQTIGEACPMLSVTCIDGYEIDYWTASTAVSTASASFEPGEHISNDEVKAIIPTCGFFLTVHTKKVTGTATFTTDGHGTATTPSEDVHLAESYEMSDDPTTKRLVGMVSACTNPTASASYEFDYWTSDVDVYSLSSGLLTAIPRDTPLTTEEVNSCYIDGDTTFTAHFKQTGPIPEPDPVDPDDGGDDTDNADTIKPADDTTSKLTPKTGDTLPGATAAVVLGAGVVAAGAALLKKRCC